MQPSPLLVDKGLALKSPVFPEPRHLSNLSSAQEEMVPAGMDMASCPWGPCPAGREPAADLLPALAAELLPSLPGCVSFESVSQGSQSPPFPRLVDG